MNSTSSSMNHGMKNYFYATVHATILFQDWHTMTWAELFGSCIAVAVLAALYEGLKVGREYLDLKFAFKSKVNVTTMHCACPNSDDRSRETGDSKTCVINVDVPNKEDRKSVDRIFNRGHVIQTLLHFVQLWISLCLMLVFMTFNVYLCLGVTVGGAIGYFCFAWLRPAPSNYQHEVCH